MTQPRELSKSERQAARAVQRALAPFLAIRSDLSLSLVDTFLTVALHPGLSLMDYVRLTGGNMQTLSRQLLDLGVKKRDGSKSFELVAAQQHPTDLRVRLYYLTARGHRLLDAALAPSSGSN